MAGVFDDLDVGAAAPAQEARTWSYDDPRSYVQPNLDPAYAKKLVDAWNSMSPAERTWLDGYGVMGGPTTHMSEAGEQTFNTPTYISRRLNDGSDYYDLWNPDGTYAERTRDGSSWVNAREGAKYAAYLAAIMYGGQAAFGGAGGGAGAGAAAGAEAAATAGGTAFGTGMTTAEQIAALQAAGMTQAEIAAMVPGAMAPGTMTAAGTLATTAGSTPTWLDTAKNVYNGIDQFANSGMGKILGTGAALALSKDAEPAPNDPMLTKADERTTQIGDKATDNAASDDAYFRSVFLPRYLAAMDQASARDKELYDFNMQRARLAAGQMDKFYGMVDAYDSEGEQQRQVGKAVAGARQANDANANMLRRRAMSMGLNPNSGAWGAGAAHLASRAALNEIFAGNMAREAARKEGLNLRATAAGLRGADSGYANSAASGANLGLGALTVGQQGVSANRASNNATLGLGLNAFSNLGGWGLSRTNSADSLEAANTAGWNGLLGYGLGQFLNRGTSTGR